MDNDPLLPFKELDAYTLADGARRHGTGGVIHALKPQTGATTFVGRAVTARVIHEPNREIPVRDYGGWQAREKMGPGDVLVLDGGGLPLTVMGALAVATLVQRGATAAVVNACVRDVEMMEQTFPVFAVGTAISTVAGHGYVTDVGDPVYIQGTRVTTGDLVAGCRGGVVVVPWDDREGVLQETLRIVESDRRVMAGIMQGEALGQIWVKHKADGN
jgi:4-hydroxy-4-methyl-2-oxoglutarate aldolase